MKWRVKDGAGQGREGEAVAEGPVRGHCGIGHESRRDKTAAEAVKRKGTFAPETPATYKWTPR